MDDMVDMKGLVKIGKYYHGNVSYRGEQKRNSLRTGHRPTAKRRLGKMKERLQQLQTGQVTLAPGADPWKYIFNGSTVPETGEEKPFGVLDLVEEYEQQLGPPKISAAYAKTQMIYLRHFRRFIAAHKNLPEAAADWQPPNIEQYRSFRLEPEGRNQQGQPVRAVTLAKEVAVLRRMFEFGRRRKRIKTNPVRDLEPIPDDAPDATFRPLDEIVALEQAGTVDADEALRFRRKALLEVREVEELKTLLWELASQHYMRRPGDLALLIHLAADAGLRLGEIARLTILDLVLNPEKETGIVTARSRKQSRRKVEVARPIPIRGDLVRRLADWVAGLEGRRLFHDATPAVFRSQVYRALDAATKGTKFAGIRPHLLRHALRTNLYEAGVDEKVIDAILGHETKEMGDRYRHIRAARLAKAMQSYTRQIQGAQGNIEGQPKGEDREEAAADYQLILVG